ncbi:hypothetical protein B0J18DRAFT_175701 [Chaetomium sp. MPI-SDFR-AT-0129]|nr:hypothetical protein B0J18DRAFT_175701 [Chaetomium sp. MPI-SDFR-AT-0129]
MLSAQDDNDDYCSSCSGNGELVCCDGCTRSFHFGCVDPVLRPEAMPVEWFCNVCRTRREPSQLPVHGGAFALVLEKLDARNSSAFRLPASVRDRFEGVRTGADGEYEEISTAPKPNARKKKNDEEQAFDNYRVRDADGNAVICHKCQQATASDRPIIPCSACGIYWHTDCLDPPMPNPPFVLRTWKCPLHADTLLATFHNTLHPAHRHRKIKDAPVISPTYKRGFANNGHIEVELDDSEDESGWRDVETFGRTVRLSEKGIKLDFISRIQQRSQARRRAALLPEPAARLSPEPTPEPVVTSDPLTQRSLNEQQAALNLARLNTARDDGVSTLIEVMISEANPSVIDLMARVQPSHLENNSQLNQLDQQGLRAILAQAESMTQHIRQLLTSAQPAQTEPTSTSSNTTHLPTSEPLDHETDNGSGSTSASGNTDPNAMDVDDNDDDNLDDDDGTTNNGAASKTPASPAPTDDVPAMTQGEKTPIQGDQSPAVPTATAAAVPPADGALVAVEKGDGNGDGVVLSTPSKTAAMIGGEEPVVLEGEGEEEGQEEKGMEI